MNTRTRIAATITGGATVVALLAATPSIAATGPTGTTRPTPAASANQQNAQQLGNCDRTGAGPGYGRGNGQGRNGQGAGMQGRGAGLGAGMGADLTGVPSGTLTATQKTKLAAMAEDEKLAHDLYVVFGDKYGTPFSRITNAETRHLTEVRIVLKRYAITDPTAGKAAGTFTTANTQQLYNKLLAQGTASVDGANTAARTVETTDITDLKAAASGVTAPDVTQVYKNLLAASQRHLVAFGG
jgi:hypothetical protein